MKTLQTDIIRALNQGFHLEKEKNEAMKPKKILFLGETFRADAQTWMNGLQEYGNFEFITWELRQYGSRVKRMLRHLEFLWAPISIRLMVATEKPDMIIAERTTSYGFLAALSGVKPIAIAQQGITDIYPLDSPFLPLKEFIQHYAFKKATLIHAWGPAMASTMAEKKTDMSKVMVLPKGINLDFFKLDDNDARYSTKIRGIVTRSLLPDYKHATIIKACSILKKKGYQVEILIAGKGRLKPELMALAKALDVEQEVRFLGSINNLALPKYLNACNFYISMPVTEGVSASLFEAMACGLYPLVTDLPGNQSWITQGQNGHLIAVEDAEMLANRIEEVWQKPDYLRSVVRQNRSFVEANANYSVNMRKIASKYHNLIDGSAKA